MFEETAALESFWKLPENIHYHMQFLEKSHCIVDVLRRVFCVTTTKVTYSEYLTSLTRFIVVREKKEKSG